MLCCALLLETKIEKSFFIYIDLIVNKNRQKEEGYWKDEQWTIKIFKRYDEVEERDINIANVIEPAEAIGLMKKAKVQHKRVFVYIAKPGELLNKDTEIFFHSVLQNKPMQVFERSILNLKTQH